MIILIILLILFAFFACMYYIISKSSRNTIINKDVEQFGTNTIQPAIVNKDDIQFIRSGSYNVSGYSLPTKEFVDGLQFKGIATVKLLKNNGRQLNVNFEAFNRKTGKIVFRGREENNSIIDPYDRLYFWSFCYVDDKLTSVKMGYGIEFKPGLLVIDISGSSFRTKSHHENIRMVLEKLSDSQFKRSMFLNDTQLLDEIVLTHRL